MYAHLCFIKLFSNFFLPLALINLPNVEGGGDFVQGMKNVYNEMNVLKLIFNVE